MMSHDPAKNNCCWPRACAPGSQDIEAVGHIGLLKTSEVYTFSTLPFLAFHTASFSAQRKASASASAYVKSLPSPPA